jgi:hypothetical protein
VTSNYAAEPMAVGTALIGAAVCGPRTASVALTGTYSGDLAGKDDLALPTKLALTGDGPWKIRLRSATTGLTLASRTLTCKPRYQLDVSKGGLSDGNKPRVRVCNAGRAPVTALLQVLGERKYEKVDKEVLNPGDCTWLNGGGKVNKGGQAKVQVLIDAPGADSDDVVTSFTVKRGRH